MKKKQKGLVPLGTALVILAAVTSAFGILFPVLTAKDADSDYPM